MIRETCIIVLAICCIFSVIPIVGVLQFNAWSLFLPVSFLLLVISYAGYDVKKLLDNGEHNLMRVFIVSLIVAIVLSMVAVYFLLPSVYRFVC